MLHPHTPRSHLKSMVSGPAADKAQQFHSTALTGAHCTAQVAACQSRKGGRAVVSEDKVCSVPLLAYVYVVQQPKISMDLQVKQPLPGAGRASSSLPAPSPGRASVAGVRAHGLQDGPISAEQAAQPRH